MADQVSLMASGGLSASRMRWLMNFLSCGPGRHVYLFEPVETWMLIGL